MNKRGSVWTTLIIIGVIIFVILIAFSAYKGIKQDVVNEGYKQIKSEWLDNSFEYLFGKDFEGSLGYIAGTNRGFVAFLGDMVIGILAAIWLLLGTLVTNLLALITVPFKKGLQAYWIKTLIRSRGGFVGYVGLIVVFPVLMQLPIINQFIKIITFYWLFGWFLYSIILAVYVGYLPKLIEAVIRYKMQARAQREIFEATAGIQKAQALGRAK